MRAHIDDIGRIADTLVCAYPNAGLPNEFGEYDESPDAMARQLGEFAVLLSGMTGFDASHAGRLDLIRAGASPRVAGSGA